MAKPLQLQSAILPILVDQITVDPEFEREIPELEKDDWEQLRESVKENGILVPLTLAEIDGEEQNVLADGHSRLRAAKLAGLTVCSVLLRQFSDRAAVLDYIDIVNLKRRHLSLEGKRAIVRSFVSRHPELSNRKAAQVAGVSDHTVAVQRRALEEGAQIAHVEHPMSSAPAKREKARQEGVAEGLSASIADHIDLVRVRVFVDYPMQSSKTRKRGTGAWALTYRREDEMKTRQLGPFPVPSGPLRTSDPGVQAKVIVEALSRPLWRELATNPIEGLAELVAEDEE